MTKLIPFALLACIGCGSGPTITGTTPHTTPEKKPIEGPESVDQAGEKSPREVSEESPEPKDSTAKDPAPKDPAPKDPETLSESPSSVDAQLQRLVGTWRLDITEGDYVVIYTKVDVTTVLRGRHTVGIEQAEMRGSFLGLTLSDGRRCEIKFIDDSTTAGACANGAFPDAGWNSLPMQNIYKRVNQ